MINNSVAVTVKQFTNGNNDRNGKAPVILVALAGKMPNRNVIAGTVAEREGFEVGKSYLAKVREVESNEYGRQFIWTKVGELSPLETLTAERDLGEAEVFSVDGESKDSNESKSQETEEKTFTTAKQSQEA